MTRRWTITLGVLATALALPAAAQHHGDASGGKGGHHGGEYGRSSDHHGAMHRGMAGMHGGGMGMHGGIDVRGGGGMMRGMEAGGPMGGMLDALDADADDDGVLTPGELRSALEQRLAEFDADGSGTLSIAEFEALHSAMIREMMVNRFQALDNDGDGVVTGDEMTAPADRMERMQQRRARMMQRRAPAEGAPDAATPMHGTGTDDASAGQAPGMPMHGTGGDAPADDSAEDDAAGN